ncbi:hypothetical protein D3C87_1352810 [compost metagenome]
MDTSPAFKIIVDEHLVRELAKEEVRRLLDVTEGSWWDLKRLESETCRKRDWLIENILLNPNFREEMKIISNNRDGGRWMFRASLMKEFLDRHFHHLNSRSKTG